MEIEKMRLLMKNAEDEMLPMDTHIMAFTVRGLFSKSHKIISMCRIARVSHTLLGDCVLAPGT